MDAGKLDQRIAIEALLPAENELGELVATWQAVTSLWAKVMETPGREFLSGDYKAEEKAVFIVRWRALDSTMRAKWGGRTWRINSVTGTRREGYAYLHCIAQDGAN